MHTDRRLWWRMLSGLLLVLGGLLLASAAQAQERERCFAETGFCVRGALLTAWEQGGGVPVFGYPISELRRETVEGNWTGPVQWFERDRLEDHGIDGIQAGRLGALVLAQQGYDWWAAPRQEPQAGCQFFAETGYNVCEPFLSAWQQGGAQRFGLPLTGPRTETLGDWTGTVQYFERRRMEHRPELADSPVLLGLLGRELLEWYQPPQVCGAVRPELASAFGRVPFRSALGCPVAEATGVPAEVQPFERGAMLWFDMGAAGRHVVALSTLPVRFQGVYSDTWQVGSPPYAGEAPAGRLRPQGSLGRVWHEQPGIAERLGWATAAPQRDQATVQRFAHGWLVALAGSNRFYALGPQAAHLTAIARPALPTDPAGTLRGGTPAPRLGGELVVQTYSVDFYRLPGGLTPAEVRAVSSAVEEAVANGSTMLGSELAGRVAIRFEPAQRGICAIRGLTLSNQRTIRMYYEPGSNLRRIEAILAHELVHQLQHDYYGVPAHLQSDIILLEGMAVWGSNPYYLDSQGRPLYHARARQALQENSLLPLTTSLEADCRTTTRNSLYDQWASFSEYLLLTYGRDTFDALYVSGRGRPAGSSDYAGVYGKPLAALEAEWLAWLRGRPE